MSRDERRWELDALRGLMLVLMTMTHLPTRVSDPAGQPVGFVSAAEGFVLLSAYMAGLVYSDKAYRQGEAAMKSAFFNRALKLYACQLALLLFAFTVIAGIGLVTREDSVTGLLGFFFEKPMVAMLSASLLLYTRPFTHPIPALDGGGGARRRAHRVSMAPRGGPDAAAWQPGHQPAATPQAAQKSGLRLSGALQSPVARGHSLRH